MVARNRRFVGAERPTRRGERLALEPLEPRVLLAAGAAVEVLNASPALFAANLGQWADPAVRYAFQTSGGNVLHTDAGPVFQLFQSEDTAEGGCATQFSVTFEGASTVAPSGQDASQAVYNYYVGDPSSWRTGVPTFQTVAYEDLWSGIDLLTWGRRDGLKYEFHVAPGADPAQIRLRYDGIEGLSLDDSGALRIATALGEVTDDAPIIYQEVGGQRVQVAGAFSLIDATTYGFAITGSYDPQAELVIDPLLGWSTYLGGASADDGYAIALDGSGAVFVTGVTASGDFPTPGGFDTTLGGTQDAFVTKLNPTGTLLWSSFLGGSGLEGGYAIAVDGSGAALVTGMTESPDFPTAGGFDTTLGGTRDAFVAKVSGAGALLWSSYLGGAGADAGYGIARDGSGAAMLTGSTESADFPTAGGFDATLGGTEDAFVTKVSGTGVLLWSSYLGGAAGTDRGYGIAVDNWGAAFLTGATSSTDFPVPGALDTSLGGPEDAFVAQVSGAGGLLWATYLGGSNADSGYGIAVDGSGNAVVTGSTQSPDFPTPVGFDTLLGGGQDAFVTKLTPTAYIWSSYLGGSAGDTGYAIALDAAGNALITGVTGSPDLATPGVFDTTLGGSLDAFVARVGVGGALLFASYLGGSGTDLGSGIAVDGSGNAFVAGMTSSPDFPTPGGIDTTLGGTGDAFVTKIVNSPPTLTAVAPLPGATEDQPFTIPYATLAGAADDADSDGDTLSFRIEAVTTGTLTEGGVPVVPGTTLLSPGESLVWTPAANANG
ncbi:MAG: LEPR-XLL domain-containing protein, partial [Planctomycetes bacterium]|nr:LEPR-XLL domain-containing protein [Planctomycetota bacterium]